MKKQTIFVFSLVLAGVTVASSQDVPVPKACNPSINKKLAELIASRPQHPVDNVMVCGVTASSSRTQRGGRHGDHQIIPLRVSLPDGGIKLVEVVSNDELDGKVTAPANVIVFAYGQAFFSHTKQFAAGIHEVHCATHRGADNGWVVVDGIKHPANCAR